MGTGLKPVPGKNKRKGKIKTNEQTKTKAELL